MKRSKPKKRSDKKKLRDSIGKLHLKYLKKQRDNYDTCEICGAKTTLGRFHILLVGTHPRLEFIDQNILLTCWMPCHYNYHHDYRKAKKIEKRIIELCGEDYEGKLLMIEKIQRKHDMLYLRALKAWFTQ